MKRLCTGVAVALCIALLVGCHSSRPEYVELSPSKKQTLLSVTNDKDPNSKNSFVSTLRVASDTYILSNYLSLLAFDRKNSALCRLEVDQGSLAQRQPLATDGRVVYNPIGVFAGADGQVCVANYNGVAVIWNAEQTTSKTIGVSDATQAGDRVVLGRYSKFAVAKVDDYAISEFRFENKENYSKFLLKTIDGGVQKRLLVHQVRPLINEADE